MGNFDEFLRIWPGVHVIKLQRNFRSTGNIVAASSHIIAKNGSSSVAADVYTTNTPGSKITVKQQSAVEEEVSFVVSDIERAHKEEGTPYRQMAVLFRTRIVGRAFQVELGKRKIPT